MQFFIRSVQLGCMEIDRDGHLLVLCGISGASGCLQVGLEHTGICLRLVDIGDGFHQVAILRA